VTGKAILAANIPANVDAPFGLAARGDEAYVTIAHADEISLVRNGEVLTVTGSGTQHAPCWVALDGPFLFSANSPSTACRDMPSMAEDRSGRKRWWLSSMAVRRTIAYHAGIAAVIDANGTVSHVSVFNVDEDGNFATAWCCDVEQQAHKTGLPSSRPSQRADSVFEATAVPVKTQTCNRRCRLVVAPYGPMR